MSSDRIRSQCGTVISADFGPRPAIQVTTEVLCHDEHICLVRYRLIFNGQVIATEHITI